MPSDSRSTLSRILTTLTLPLRKMLAFLLTFFTLRNILLAFLVLNYKTLPAVWEIRLIYRSWQAWLNKRGVARILERAANKSNTQSTSTVSSPSETASLPSSTHPLFAPRTMTSRSPLLEIDHNFHKSNSTYFTDLDESRTSLMVHLLSSTRFSPAELDKEGVKGRFAVILASVHATFLKEIKPYEKYSVRSRILGWDNKWILIGSVFIRPKNQDDRRRERKEKERKAKLLAEQGEGVNVTTAKESETGSGSGSIEKGEVLLATCLSKYVVKKGRFTVPPERCWRSAGWLPKRPEGETTSPTPPVAMDSSAVSTPDSEFINGEIKLTEDDLRRRAQETAARAVEKLKSGEKHTDTQNIPNQVDEACENAASRWSWDEIEKERARGMKVADGWFRLDADLKGLWEDDHEREMAG